MTPAVTMAKKAGVKHTLHRYAHDPDAQSYGGEAAEKLGLSEDRVFKTLLASMSLAGRETLVVGVVPVGGLLDLKRLAAALGGKKAVMADVAEAQRATGYLVGGISPLGQKRKLPTVIDDTALQFDTVFVSAGRRGLEIELSPHDLKKLTSGRTAAIAAD
ncbi:MAG: Cys-tRNA(Pro) deacylase [Rhodospirillales bacterium]|nr:Cys-tRNA(Pro) deacylase [Alphaproteobacteria bacterium]MBL6928523.1 Cys-tRNA(Pro) deacylase [Rhodospirillales bacterium]